jgi:hypothetical protein
MMLAGARESSRDSVGARELNSLGSKHHSSGVFFFRFFFFFGRCTCEKSSTCRRALVISSLALGA